MSVRTASKEAWWADRACASVDPELFFPVNTQQGHEAQRICASCPVLARCAVLAQEFELQDCVAASVWIPARHCSAASVEQARRELAEVAVTGRPAPLMAPMQARRDNSRCWDDPEFQAQVAELRGQGLAWDLVAERLGKSATVVQKAHSHTPKEFRADLRRGKSGPRVAAVTCVETAPAAPVVMVEPRKYATDFEFQQRVVQLRIGDERSWVEIALALGCAPKTARTAFALVQEQAVAS